MPTNTSPEYTDVCRQDDPFPTWSFRSELVVYQEFLIRGQSVGRNWNGAGFMHPDSQRINTDNHPAAPTFAIELDGQLLNSHWMLTKETKLLATHGLHIVMELAHSHRPVKVKLLTHDGTEFLTRWLETINSADQPVPLSAAFIWSGILQELSGLGHQEESAYRLGFFDDTHWGTCGDFTWHTVPSSGYRVDGHNRWDRHCRPQFIFNNR